MPTRSRPRFSPPPGSCVPIPRSQPQARSSWASWKNWGARRGPSALQFFPNGYAAMSWLAQSTGTGEIGITQVTEILNTRASLRRSAARRVPDERVYSVGLAAQASEARRAQDFIGRFAGPSARALLAKRGTSCTPEVRDGWCSPGRLRPRPGHACVTLSQVIRHPSRTEESVMKPHRASRAESRRSETNHEFYQKVFGFREVETRQDPRPSFASPHGRCLDFTLIKYTRERIGNRKAAAKVRASTTSHRGREHRGLLEAARAVRLQDDQRSRRHSGQVPSAGRTVAELVPKGRYKQPAEKVAAVRPGLRSATLA